MARIFSPGRAMQLDTWVQNGGGPWGPSSVLPRGFGLASAIDGEPTKTTNRWVMTDGLVRPNTLGTMKRLVLQVALDPTYIPATWRNDVITTGAWLAQMNTTWSELEVFRQLGHSNIDPLFVKSNAWTFTVKPDYATDNPPPPTIDSHATERQIDVGPLGVYIGNEAGELLQIGDLFVMDVSGIRSEIWVVDGTYASHVPPGMTANDPAHWLTLAPSPNFPPGSEPAPQDFIDDAWNRHGFRGPPTAALISAVLSNTMGS